MTTKGLAIAVTVGAIAVAALLVAYPAMAASAVSSPQNSSIQTSIQQNLQGKTADKLNLTAGQSFTLTSVAGGYREIGDRDVNGTAAGTLTLTVTGAFKSGYSLSMTGGQLTVNGTTYTVTGGSGELGRYGVYATGQGQAGSTAQFLFAGRNLGLFGNADYGVLRVDLTNGSGEFAVKLLVTIAPA